MSKKYYIIGGIIVILLIALVGLLLLSGKTNNNVPAGNVELTWWKTFEDPDNVQQLIADYESSHKNVTINYVKKDVTTYQNDLVQAFASGNGPDIFSIHNDWLPSELDKMAPMPNSSNNIRTYKAAFADVASGDFIKDNQIYAVPMNLDVLALYYNKDLLGSAGISTPPTTWNEFESDVEKITKQDRPGNFVHSGTAMGVASNVNRAVDILSLLMLQNGTQMYNSDFTSAMFDQTAQDGSNTNPGATALQFFTQFADPTKRSYTWNAKADNSVDAFTQNKVGMMLSYYYMKPQIQAKGPNINWDVAAAPQISSDPSLVKVNFANYWGEGVYKNSKSTAVAWDFLNFITSKDELNKYYTQHKLIASRKDILSTQISDPEIGVYAESALTAKSVYKKDAGNFEAVFSKMIDDVSVRSLSVEESISNAAQQINLQLQGQG